MEVFAKNLKDCLMWKGITQVKLSQMLNVHKTAVSQWVKGRTIPTLDMFYRICLILNETPNYFLGFKEY